VLLLAIPAAAVVLFSEAEVDARFVGPWQVRILQRDEPFAEWSFGPDGRVTKTAPSGRSWTHRCVFRKGRLLIQGRPDTGWDRLAAGLCQVFHSITGEELYLGFFYDDDFEIVSVQPSVIQLRSNRGSEMVLTRLPE
jgi:hypothetical protein